MSKYLLPNGIYDLLPIEAKNKRIATEKVLEVFEKNGYEYVLPPLIEFEESLLSGKGRLMSKQTFRMLDPVSQKILAARPDITLQVARIAKSRLSSESLPLRLCYSGDVLWVKGSHLRGERQHSQVGIELIGAPSPLADAEVISIGVEALEKIGITKYTVDLNAPHLIRLILRSESKPVKNKSALINAISRKDVSYINNSELDNKNLILDLMASSGHYYEVLTKLAKMKMPEGSSTIIDDIAKICESLTASHPKLSLTVDASETRGFEYHTGITFTFFSSDTPEELGRGGRYDTESEDGENLNSTGLTFYFNTISRIISAKFQEKRVLVACNTRSQDIDNLKSQGYTIVRGFEKNETIESAKRKHCQHLFKDSVLISID